ncbi:hypothetical protein DL765_009375 [Monosporascus sp. GIB2]|nr:hypothetical protein DL765_009375 [Monosporascus sp. GIB2]
MSSTYTVSPKSLHDLGDHPRGRMLEPHLVGAQNNYNQNRPITPVDSNLLSAYSSQVRSSTTSPDANSCTPAESVSYQPSDYSSEFAGDPFFGANFNDVETGTPAFLDELSLNIDYQGLSVARESPAEGNVTRNLGYPISPRKSPSTHTTSSLREDTQAPPKSQVVVATQSLTKSPGLSINPVDSGQSSPQLTPDTNGSGWSRSSTDSPAPVPAAMADQSPRVTVSIYGRDGERPVQGAERHLPSTAESPKTVRGPHSLADDLATELAHGTSSGAPGDAQGFSDPDWTTGPRGLAPGDRPPDDVTSPNQQAARREIDEKNQEIFNWVSRSNDPNGDRNDLPPSDSAALCSESSSTPYANEDNIPEREIPLGDATENRHQPGQSYYRTDGPGGPITEIDFAIMRQLRTWEDAPAIHGIQTDRRQPESSQAAIQRFMQQHYDTASIVSRTATWGTRRRSLPSVMDEQGVLSGNFLKKLTISGNSRRPSIRERAEKLIRLPSIANSRKRKGSSASDLPPEDLQTEEGRRESRDSLASPSRTTSWGRGGNRKPTPSLGNALAEMAKGAAAVGTTHARTSSISATPVTSPKSPFGSFSGTLKVPPVKNTIRRSRSKTELPSKGNAEGLTHPNLVGMLKKQGGPPVALLAKSRPAVDDDEDEDEDDDILDDADVKPDAGRLEDITPDAEGFKQHILRLNPRLASIDGHVNPNNYLVERIVYQQLLRYKHLCTAKIKHLGQVNQRRCPSGAMCIASGGSAIPLDNRGDARGVDPLSARPDSSDGDTSPLDGGISPESFPQGIPMPPTTTLPAEFECQLCFCNKKFHKPSDWTKHVHEDVQPFTCTWDRCKEPKMFKRKADWVRHENEGHRHLEWWTCDVEDCRHTCYRRDNFLQHLVREHKFAEPKIKTKAAIKKAGGGDRTWQRVEQCHVETDRKPQDEPCRFCGKTFPTWKKLTVHLAKHMEHISLPVLKLVAAKELEADTVISPVQDPPPRAFGPPPVPVIKQEPPRFTSPGSTHSSSNASPIAYHDEAPFGYTNMPRAPLQAPYYAPQAQRFAEVPSRHGNGLMMPQVTTGMDPQPHYQHMPVTTGPYGQPVGSYMNLPNQGNFHTQGLEPFPAFDSLGIQDPSGAMAYEGFGDSSLLQQPMERYSNPGSVSPYTHSPHQGHSGYYNQ